MKKTKKNTLCSIYSFRTVHLTRFTIVCIYNRSF